jgi:hypothetical protein
MSKVNPDLVNKMQRYIASGMDMFGQPITLRKYVSASAGNPDLGIADQLCYQERPTQCELRVLSLVEMQAVGGQDIRGTYEVMIVDSVDLRDEIIYNGETYRWMSQPEQEVIGARIYSKGLIQRASITGYFA